MKRTNLCSVYKEHRSLSADDNAGFRAGACHALGAAVGPPADLLPITATNGCVPLENSIASTSIFVLQATKSQRWMPWRLKPKKDVGGCDKPRGAAYQALIRGYPNGETHRSTTAVLRPEHIGPAEGTRGIETSQYPKERKATATP
jgi:hypothetical protein